MPPSPAAVPPGTLPYSAESEPLCLPPQPEELSAAARKRLPEVEGEMRRRLSGADRSVEAVEMEALVAGVRTTQPAPAPADPFLESGVLALCAAHLLGRPALIHLPESLALRGIKVSRGTLNPEQPPRALDGISAMGLHARMGHALSLAGPERRDPEPIEVYHAAPKSPAARALLGLSGAGLTRPVILIAPMNEKANEKVNETVNDETGPRISFHYAGLSPTLSDIVTRAAAPHLATDATRDVAPLQKALAGRNPWHLYRIAEVLWPTPWNGPQIVHKPQLSEAGVELAQKVLSRPPDADESFALACHALAAAARLSDLLPEAPPTSDLPPGPIPCDAELEEERERLVEALSRLTRRPLLPMQDGEAPLFLKAAHQAGTFVLDQGHRDEMGRLLTLASPGCYARLRLFHFPREAPRALSVTVRNEESPPISLRARPVAWFVDGGDLRVHVELVHAGSLLRGLP